MNQFRTRIPQNFPPVVKNLLIINALVFAAQLLFAQKGTDLVEYGGLFHWHLADFKPYQFFTHMFMHGGWMHILFNMFGLWMFGRVLENIWGPKRFLLFYFICGFVAAVAQQAVGGFEVAIGASGAIMGIFAAFAYLFPNTELYIMFIPFPIKAKWAVLGLAAIALFSGVANVAGDNVAHFAHLGGAATGFIIVLIWNKTNRKTFY